MIYIQYISIRYVIYIIYVSIGTADGHALALHIDAESSLTYADVC
jgi:hypothetical protein